MQEKILDFLKRKQEYVSGDQLSQKLGISRQALWKHMQELKGLGYEIIAVPHLGYQLVSCPDRLFSFEVNRGLNTKLVGKKIYYSESTNSTMDSAMQLGMAGASEGTLFLTESQAKGRGRLGRVWFSPKYKGIYMSLILRPKLSLQDAPILTLLAAVSICEAIKEIEGLKAQIKWPNDIFLQNKKAGGILTELSAEVDQVRFIVIGIGLNVNNDKKSLISTAISLREAKKENIDRISLLQEILRKIEANYFLLQEKSSRPIIEKWRQYNITLGKRVKVYSQAKHSEGQAVDIDTDGGLLLRNDQGVVEKIMAGDVMQCR